MDNKKRSLGIDSESLHVAQGIAICLLAIFFALNYGVVSQFIFWCVSFFAGSLFTYLIYIILFVYGLTFIFQKKITIRNLKFSVIGLIVLSLGILIISTCSISYLENGEYLTFKTFKEIYLASLNLANFPKIEINQSGGIFGYLFVAILNSAFTDLGTIIFAAILICIGTFFILFRPFVLLFKSSKEIEPKQSQNMLALNELDDEELLTNTTLYRDGNLEYEEIEPVIQTEEDKNDNIMVNEQKELEIKEEVAPLLEETSVQEIFVEEKEEPRQAFILQTNGLKKVRFDPDGNSDKELFSNLVKYDNEDNFVENKQNKVKDNFEFQKDDVSPTINDQYFEENVEPLTNNDISEEEPLYIQEENKEIEEELFIKQPAFNNASLIKNEEVVVKPNYQEEIKQEATLQKTNKPRKNIKFVSPPMDLLIDKINDKVNDENIFISNQRMEKINEILADLKIGAKVISYKIGPSVTRFDLQTDRGVSINGFEKYISDISIKLGGLEARFVPVIQGKSTSGIEIENVSKNTVYFKDVYAHLPEKKPGKFFIPFGKNISGDYIQADLADFPHLLVCGTTGSGKSIFMHSVILSLIMRSSMDELRLVMVDPKRVEFGKYKDLPHLLCPIISEPIEANATLLKLVDEMEDRFTIFENTGVSNIKQYNEYARDNNIETLPYIIVIVDEYADLVDSVKAIAQPVQRLGQKARAAGIHMIIATQRPSTDVITGTIKANLTVRVALMTSSATDSVVALGEGGAEKLLGNGDMLVSCPLVSKQEKIRVQGCLVENPEIQRVCTYLKDKYPLEYNEKFLNLLEKSRVNSTDFGVIHPSNGEDEKYEEIKKYIMETKDYCSISMIQREFQFGYARSSKIFNRLLEENIIEKASSGNSSKGAKVLVHIGGFKSIEDGQSGNPGSYSQSTFESK